jgi:hypothetical protein
VYNECNKINLPDAQGTRAVRDFVRAVATIIPESSIYWTNDISKAKDLGQNAPDLYRIVELSETTDATWPLRKARSLSQPSRQDCFYLVEEKRPRGWKANQSIQERVDAKLQNPRIKEAVDRTLPERRNSHRHLRIRKTLLKPTPSRWMEPLPSLPLRPQSKRARTLCTTALSLIQPQLFTFAIKRERFQTLRPASGSDYLTAGASRIPIEGYGLVEITLKLTPTSSRKIKLAEVALVPSFHTNIVALDRLMQRNVHWNTEQQELRRKSEIFGIVEKNHGQWVLKYSPLQTASFTARSTRPRPDLVATADQ